MSINYCSIIAKTQKILLAESTTSESYNTRIKGLFSTILKKSVLDIIEIEGEQLVTYLRTKQVIFICVSSSKHGEERARRFIEQFAASLVKEFGSVDAIVAADDVKKLCLQERLGVTFNKLLDSFDTGMYKNKDAITGMNKDLDEIKQTINTSIKQMVTSKDELDEMLLTSQKINVKAKEYKEEAAELEYETRCVKPWMIIVMVILLVLFITYTIFALYLCGSMTLFCERKKYYSDRKPLEFLK